MNRIVKLGSLILALFILANCSSTTKSNVTRFHQLPSPNGQSIEVIAMDPTLQQSIEFGAYAELVGQKLGTHGYAPPTGNATNYVAEISYNIRPLRETIVEDRSPVSVGVGVGSGGRRGTSMGVGISTGFGSSEQKVEYVSVLNMNIIRLSDGKRLYEGRVENLGRNQNLAQVMPILVEALFQDFPGESGSSDTVEHSAN